MKSSALLTISVVVTLTVLTALWRWCEEISAIKIAAQTAPFTCKHADLDLESRLVCGHPLPLEEVDESILELLPGISTRRALSLIASRDAIRLQAASFAPDQRYHAFEVAAGIGPITARELGRFLQITPIEPTPGLAYARR